MTQALQPSYLSQVRKLRQMAEQVVKSYPIQNPQIQFIHHGENTTFKVSSTKRVIYYGFTVLVITVKKPCWRS